MKKKELSPEEKLDYCKKIVRGCGIGLAVVGSIAAIGTIILFCEKFLGGIAFLMMGIIFFALRISMCLHPDKFISNWKKGQIKAERNGLMS